MKADVPPTEEDQDDMGEDEEYDEDEEDEGQRVSHGARGMTGSGGMLFENDLMEAAVRSSRRKEHQSWPQITQICWDRESQHLEMERRCHAELLAGQAEMMRRQELYSRSLALSHEEEINRRYAYDEQVSDCDFN